MQYSNISSNKRIAKNTMMLYFRMILIMLVSLYTSRIVLNTLGVDDFGIYNVVGGFVMMFGFLNSAMASATQRFLAFEIGKNDKVQLRNVFSMSVNIHFLIAFAIFIFAETIGLWFVNTQLTIPSDRMDAARCVFHFSILTLIVSMVSVPYNAMIIANERMGVFARVSIIEVSLKLLIVYMLQWFGFDKLKLYAILMFAVSLIIRLLYGLYCNRNFKESNFRFYWDVPLFKRLLSYAGWNLWGNSAVVLKDQGVNILLNIYFGPSVNAARAIAFQVNGAVNQFVQNFQMAIKPQIIKSYAINNTSYFHDLIFQGAKYSFFLLFLLTMPVLLETRIILKLWLNIIPDYTVIFIRLIIVGALIECWSGTLMTAAHASGRIKLYQGIVGGLLLLNLPVSYLFLTLNFSPEITFIINIFISIIALVARILIISSLVNFKPLDFFKKVMVPSMIVLAITVVFSFWIQFVIEESFARLILVIFLSSFFVIFSVFFFGLNHFEQQFLKERIKQLSRLN